MNDLNEKNIDSSNSKDATRIARDVVTLFALFGICFLSYTYIVVPWINKEFQKIVEEESATLGRANDSAVKYGEEYPDSPAERFQRQAK